MRKFFCEGAVGCNESSKLGKTFLILFRTPQDLANRRSLFIQTLTPEKARGVVEWKVDREFSKNFSCIHFRHSSRQMN